MIYSFLNQGSGVGNQLHRYIATKIKTLQLNTDYRLLWIPDNSGKQEGFKCKDFMQFDESKVIKDPPIGAGQWYEKKITDQNGVDIRGYDPEWNFVKDNTLIEGEFQDEKYWEDYEKELNDWLKTKPLDMPNDLCVISHRGGEYAIFPDLFLPTDYWNYAISEMRKINPKMKFQIQTDDIITAKKQFPDFEIIHDIGYNWRSIRFARYLIMSNSSFGILPSWLNKNAKLILAPKYHARHNTGVWCTNQNFYKKYTYIDKNQYM